MGMLPFILQSIPFQNIIADNAYRVEMEVDGTTLEAAGKRWLETYNPFQPPPYDSTPSDTFLDAVCHDMLAIARSILGQLSSLQSQEFLQVWADDRSIFIEEYEQRCQYNRSS